MIGINLAYGGDGTFVEWFEFGVQFILIFKVGGDWLIDEFLA